MTIRGSDLAQSTLQESVVNDFKASLQGPLLCPGNAGYDDARPIWNGMIDKRPALIARCRGVADIINSVTTPPAFVRRVRSAGGLRSLPARLPISASRQCAPTSRTSRRHWQR